MGDYYTVLKFIGSLREESELELNYLITVHRIIAAQTD